MISLGADLGMGQPMEHGLRQSLVALRLAERLGLDEETRGVVYYVSLIAWVGCHVDAYEQAKWFGDDLALKADTRRADMASVSAKVPHPEPPWCRPQPAGAGAPGRQVRRRRAAAERGDRESLCGHHPARRRARVGPRGAGMRGSDVRALGRQGRAGGLKGEQIVLPARVVNLADVVAAFHRAGGVDAAVAVARERSGTQFDPALVQVFCAEAPQVLGGLDEVASWPAVIEAEPTLEVVLSDEQLDSALEAIADFTDLKSPWTMGHSRGVADLVFAAATAYGLSDDEAKLVRRAGLVHDLGRLGVSNAIWDKRGPLTPTELERVRLHPYLTERMLASSEALAPLGAIAVQHHERLDGSGYPRGLSGDSLTPAGRILAAADAYHAMTEPRPHRDARTADEAAAELRSGVREALFDSDAAEAVLGAAGHRGKRRRDWPGGLTSREIEVLRLLVRGLSNKEIAEQLVISRKTAGSHVEHIYSKAGVSNRAQASLFAIKHGLTAGE